MFKLQHRLPIRSLNSILFRNYSTPSIQSFLQELQNRNIIFQQTDQVDKILDNSKEPLKIYAGFDPTSDGLHVGNLIVLQTMKRFLQIPHVSVVALIGGGTGLIGDPSGRKSERPLLTTEKIDNNVEGLKNEITKFFSQNTEKVTIVNNGDWLRQLLVIDLLRDVGKYFQMNNLLRLDSVKSRLDTVDEKNQSGGMTFTEFSYAIFQSYDFYHLYQNYNVKIQIGGSDQWGNITSGIEFVRKKVNLEEKDSTISTPHVPIVGGITIPLLTTADGQKFGKSAGNAIWLNPNKTSVYDFYQYFVRVQDTDVEKLLKMLTELSLEEISSIMQLHAQEPEKRIAQKALAKEVTTLIHGTEEFEKAKQSAELLFGSEESANWKELSRDQIAKLLKDAPTISLPWDTLLTKPIFQILKEGNICKSASDAKRTITGGGFYVNNGKIDQPSHVLSKESDFIEQQICVVRLGKKNYYILQGL